MADGSPARDTARDAVVRPLSRAAVRPCARPGCPSPARATLSFRYATREASLEALAAEDSPATYDLCSAHADRTRPPHGWGLVDQRPAEDVTPGTGTPSRDLGDERTVAVLAAALRAVPDAAVAGQAGTDMGDTASAPRWPDPAEVAELDLPDDVRAEIEDALAELHAVARTDEDAGAEQVAIDVEGSGDDPDHEPRPGPEPRPVPAARERDTAARTW